MHTQDYFQTVLEFLKLEKVEFGGVKGLSLGEMVVQIYNEFQELMSRFTNSTYNPLDVNSGVRTGGPSEGSTTIVYSIVASGLLVEGGMLELHNMSMLFFAIVKYTNIIHYLKCVDLHPQ